MEFKVWLAYLLTEILVSITPGPAIIFISSQGLRYGAKSSFFGSLGISSGNLLYFFLSACGIGTLILTAGNLFQYIKICGAIYLMITGTSMFYKSMKSNVGITGELVRKQSSAKSFLQGFITETANPKAIIFFVALIPLFIDETKNISVQFALMGLTTIVVESFILMGYGWLAAQGKKRASRNKQLTKWKDRLAGTVLLSLGLKLIFTKVGSH